MLLLRGGDESEGLNGGWMAWIFMFYKKLCKFQELSLVWLDLSFCEF